MASGVQSQYGRRKIFNLRLESQRSLSEITALRSRGMVDVSVMFISSMPRVVFKARCKELPEEKSRFLVVKKPADLVTAILSQTPAKSGVCQQLLESASQHGGVLLRHQTAVHAVATDIQNHDNTGGHHW